MASDHDWRPWRGDSELAIMKRVEGLCGSCNKPKRDHVKAGAQSVQVGGDHYLKRSIQPWDIWAAYPEMDAFTATVIKYMLRWPDKNGLDDLRKARHTLNRLIEIEEGKLNADLAWADEARDYLHEEGQA